MKIGDYIEPTYDKEIYSKFLDSIGIEYEDLFGIVVEITPAYKGLSISIKSLRTGKISNNWNGNFFKQAEVPLELKDRYQYMLNIPDNNIGVSKLK